MAARGRPLKDEEEKERAGTRRKGRDRGEAPQIEPAILPPPDHLSAEARAEWRRLLPVISRSGIFTPADAVAFEAYCVSVAFARRAKDEIGDVLIIDLPNGFKQADPALELMAKFYKLATDFGQRFGLDPTSRSRLRVPKKEPDVKTNPVQGLRKRIA